MEKKYYICKRMRMRSYLAERGFTEEYSTPDMFNSKFTVWGYLRTPELQQAIDEYYADTRKDR